MFLLMPNISLDVADNRIRTRNIMLNKEFPRNEDYDLHLHSSGLIDISKLSESRSVVFAVKESKRVKGKALRTRKERY